LPECVDGWVNEGNSVRAVDVFGDALDLRDSGVDGVEPAGLASATLLIISCASLNPPERPTKQNYKRLNS
jgi:hypothetical protein